MNDIDVLFPDVGKIYYYMRACHTYHVFKKDVCDVCLVLTRIKSICLLVA